ncbi:MAG: methionine adenosyltransferase [Angustibacter sp.]
MITVGPGPSPADLPVEIVERKGIGHPDTLADALAERMSVAYSRYCRDEFGAVLHHNLDKLYLRGGHARTSLGTFEMTEPTVLVIGGRVSTGFAGQPVDHRGLFEHVATDYLTTVLPHFDADKWLRIEHATTDRSRFPTWFRPESLDDLPELRHPTSSDTVAVTSWWPHTPTERTVLAVERYLNQEAAGPRYTHLGQDIKVMACRHGRRLDITVNVAVHPDAAPTVNAYESVLTLLHSELQQVATESAAGDLDPWLHLNTTQTNPHRGKRQYLLGSGTCLEFGEEGFVGRGNGASGLIAVHRPKSVEAPYGKNPTYHSGKVYTLYAEQISRAIHHAHDVGATVTIMANHSTPLREPTHVAIDLHGHADHHTIHALAQTTLSATDHLSLSIDEHRIVPR